MRKPASFPGSGPVQTRADLEAQQEMLVTMKERLIKLMRSGMGPDDIIAAAPTREFDARWGNPERFLEKCLSGHVGTCPRIGRNCLMSRYLVVAVAFALAVFSSGSSNLGAAREPQQTSSPVPSPVSQHRALLDQYCVTCQQPASQKQRA